MYNISWFPFFSKISYVDSYITGQDGHGYTIVNDPTTPILKNILKMSINYVYYLFKYMTGHIRAYLPSHYITATQFQYILTISIAWEFATN